MAIGFRHVRIISPERGRQVADALRDAGYGVTEIFGRGKDGRVVIVTCSARRRDVTQVEALATYTDLTSFMTVEEVRPLRRGYWRGL